MVLNPSPYEWDFRRKGLLQFNLTRDEVMTQAGLNLRDRQTCKEKMIQPGGDGEVTAAVCHKARGGHECQQLQGSRGNMVQTPQDRLLQRQHGLPTSCFRLPETSLAELGGIGVSPQVLRRTRQ